MLRAVSDALVQEPKSWEFILKLGQARASKLDAPVGLDALAALSEAFHEASPSDRDQVRKLAIRLVDEERSSLQTRKSPKALAGQSLLSSLEK